MIKKMVLLVSVLLMLIPAASADDITLSLNQSDYYFLLGEEAIVPLEVLNTYGKQINGVLSYSITQEINQQGFHYSSSNTRSTSFPVENGKSTVSLGFGTSDSPMTLKVGLTFSYNDKEQREVNLQDITIHFVARESDKNNEEKNMQSSSQKAGQQQGQSQQGQQVQEMIDQMFNNQPSQNPQQRLQNNQMSQDSSALKQQMQKQLQEQQKLKEEFQKQLSQNSEFQEQHQELLQQGYNINSASINPSTNNSGTFEINYQKENGESATLKGEMQNGEIKSLQKQTSGDRQKLLDRLNQSEQFQQYREQLEKQGFTPQNTEFTQEGNRTSVRLNYQNNENQTAVIKAEFMNNTIENVELEKGDDNELFLWILLPLVLLCAAVLYRKYAIRPVEMEKTEIFVKKEPFDHVAEARNMLEESKQLFEQEHYKDAYGRAGQAIRLFLSYENRLNWELTNDELIQNLRTHGKSHREIKECFDLCSLVEFAKYEANREDFDRIVSTAEKVIEKRKKEDS